MMKLIPYVGKETIGVPNHIKCEDDPHTVVRHRETKSTWNKSPIRIHTRTHSPTVCDLTGGRYLPKFYD